MPRYMRDSPTMTGATAATSSASMRSGRLSVTFHTMSASTTQMTTLAAMWPE